MYFSVDTLVLFVTAVNLRSLLDFAAERRGNVILDKYIFWKTINRSGLDIDLVEVNLVTLLCTVCLWTVTYFLLRRIINRSPSGTYTQREVIYSYRKISGEMRTVIVVFLIRSICFENDDRLLCTELWPENNAVWSFALYTDRRLNLVIHKHFDWSSSCANSGNQKKNGIPSSSASLFTSLGLKDFIPRTIVCSYRILSKLGNNN